MAPSSFLNADICLTVPERIRQSTIPNKDYGFVVELQSLNNVAVAQSLPCAFLESNKRPCWAVIQFDPIYFVPDTLTVQNNIMVGVIYKADLDS